MLTSNKQRILLIIKYTSRLWTKIKMDNPNVNFIHLFVTEMNSVDILGHVRVRQCAGGSERMRQYKYIHYEGIS